MARTPDIILNPRKVIWACIAVILLIALYPILATGYVVPDDFQFSLWASDPDSWEKAYITAQSTGRFQNFFHIAIAYLPYVFDNYIVFRVFQIGSIVATALAFSFAIRRYLDSIYHGLVALLLFGALLQNMWDHYIFAAYPFVFQFGLFFLSLSFICFKNFLELKKPSDAWKAAIFLFIALLTYEAFAVYIVVLLVVGWIYNTKSDARSRVVCVLPVMAPVILFISIYLVWRASFPSDYAGAKIEFLVLEWSRVWDVIWQFSKASAPGFVYSHFGHIHYEFALAPEGFRRSFEFFLLNLQVEWLIKAIMVGAGLWLIQRHVVNNTNSKKFWGMMAVGVLLFLLPPIPLALTPKYQEWVQNGAPAYVITYFSYFGVLLILAGIFGYLGNLGNPQSAIRRMSNTATIALVVLLSLITDYGNASMHRTQELDAWKWKLFDQLIMSTDFSRVADRSCLLIDGLSEPLVFGYTHPDFWGIKITQKTNKQFIVHDQPGEFFKCMSERKSPGFLIRYRQERNVANQFIMLAEVERHDGLQPIGDKAVIMTAPHSRKFFATMVTAGDSQSDSAIIDGATVNATKRQSVFPVDSSKQHWGIVRTEISKPGLILNSVSQSYFIE